MNSKVLLIMYGFRSLLHRLGKVAVYFSSGMAYCVSWWMTTSALLFLILLVVLLLWSCLTCILLLLVATWARGNCCSKLRHGFIGETCTIVSISSAGNVLFASKVRVVLPNQAVYCSQWRIHTSVLNMWVWILLWIFPLVIEDMMQFLLLLIDFLDWSALFHVSVIWLPRMPQIYFLIIGLLNLACQVRLFVIEILGFSQNSGNPCAILLSVG